MAHRLHDEKATLLNRGLRPIQYPSVFDVSGFRDSNCPSPWRVFDTHRMLTEQAGVSLFRDATSGHRRPGQKNSQRSGC